MQNGIESSDPRKDAGINLKLHSPRVLPPHAAFRQAAYAASEGGSFL